MAVCVKLTGKEYGDMDLKAKKLRELERVVMEEYERGDAPCPVCGGHKFDEREEGGAFYLAHREECEVASLMGYPVDVSVPQGGA